MNPNHCKSLTYCGSGLIAMDDLEERVIRLACQNYLQTHELYYRKGCIEGDYISIDILKKIANFRTTYLHKKERAVLLHVLKLYILNISIRIKCINELRRMGFPNEYHLFDKIILEEDKLIAAKIADEIRLLG